MTLPVVVVALLLLVAILLAVLPGRGKQPRRLRTRRRSQPSAPSHRRVHPPKPPWVRREVLRLKALMPEAGCRRVAETFNRLHQSRKGMTVGKTFVADTIRQHGEELLRLRREIKHRQPRPLARNVIWALDWTWVSGADGASTPVLGVLDHGSRACLELQPVESRRTVAVLRQLLGLFERFGTPKVLRTDNEPAVRSLLFRAALRLLGVRHQRTDPCAPWQNGRIERLFGTVKEVLRKRKGRTGAELVTDIDLQLIRTWYNHLRPHQHLGGRTPAEAWSEKETDRKRRTRWVSHWDGLLAGCYWPD